MPLLQSSRHHNLRVCSNCLCFLLLLLATTLPGPAVSLQRSPPLGAWGLRQGWHQQLGMVPPALGATPDHNNNENNDSTSKAQIRFSGLDLASSSTGSATQNKSPLDWLFAGLTSDVGSIAIGTLGLLALLVGRLVLDNQNMDDDSVASIDALGQATRVNLLAVLGTGAILLNGVSKLDVQSALAEKVQLLGVSQSPPLVVGGPQGGEATGHETDENAAIAWTLESLLVASPAASALLLRPPLPATASTAWSVTACAGIVPERVVQTLSTSPTTGMTLTGSTPILDRFLPRRRGGDAAPSSSSAAATTITAETYLPTLQALPGRVEFLPYLPSNTQAALLVPVVATATAPTLTNKDRQVVAVLALGANQARSFTPRDIAWCQLVAARLGETAMGVA